MKIQLIHKYEDIISVENLLAAWQEFILGKRSKPDVQEFALHFMDNILQLHAELANGTYRHGGYKRFNISDPKPRIIHKAIVRDRLLHHAIYRMLYPFFDRTFIADSYSCRINKGTHKALKRFQFMARKVSRNHTRACWVLQCDVRKFFASINQGTLKQQLSAYTPDSRINALLNNVIDSFFVSKGKGLPLGNLTSQLFVNVHMNSFDQFMKHRLHIQHYIRYADDFVTLSANRHELVQILPKIQSYLTEELKLDLHPKKLQLRTVASGIDFLGWIHFPHHRVLRTATKRGMMRRINEHPTNETFQSYYGMLQHGDTHELSLDVQGLEGLLAPKSL